MPNNKTDERFIVHYFFINKSDYIGKSIFYIRRNQREEQSLSFGRCSEGFFFYQKRKINHG